ncbi:MAG: hypothetical protein KGL39_30370 [Patescibacteria group bacterium]|nr:hypothetical protein [Patescibacteria group bacterium]
MTDKLAALALILDRFATEEREAVRTKNSHAQNADHRGAARAYAHAAQMVRELAEGKE